MARQDPPAKPGIPAIWQRKTRGGRTLEYELTVIQQPERARACGSGAKSSADRRPVDPPPVVELRISSISSAGKEDITFTYDANFFLFATLEVAQPIKPIAPHRGQGQQAQQIPVLTGMPVSGMAYLDRPNMAGYFIFPDLSVRHEGIYALSFNLYEETKDLADMDLKDENNMGAGPSPDASFDWRMEVKSDPFQVYSAKKFPGLAESTALSRTVAEQGCRVRIRRDVRMRRRGSHPKGDSDDAHGDEERGRAEDHYAGQRSRSNSPDSDDGYSQDPSQRMRNNSDNTHNSARPVAGWLASTEAGRFAPQQPPPPPPLQPIRQTYAHPQSTSHHGAPMHYAQYQNQQPPPPPNSHHHYHQPQHPQSAHPDYAPREAFESDRRQSYPVYASQASQHAQYHTTPSERQYDQYQPQLQPSYAHRIDTAAQANLPPMKNISNGFLESNYENVQSQAGRVTSLPRVSAPPAGLNAPPTGLFHGHERGIEAQPSLPYNAPQPLQELPRQAGTYQEPPRHTGKRQFDSAFAHSLKNEPLVNGMRPASPHDQDEDDQEALDVTLMQYKRADGRNTERPPPQKLRTYS